MKLSAGKVVKYVALLLLMAVMLFFAFRNMSWADFTEGLRNCDYRWILGTMLLQWIITYLRGNRWRVMMRPISRDITRRETYDSYAICYLANIAFPRSGEVVRCGLLARTHKTSFESALGTVVIERTWDLVCMLLCCVPLFFFGRFRDFLVEKMFRPAAESMHLSWLAIVLIAAALIAGLFFLIRANKERIARNKAGAAFIKFGRGLLDGVKAVFTMDRKWLFIAYSVLIWIGYWLCSLWTLYAFPATAGMDGLDALFIMVVGSLGWLVPVQGGFGAYHFIVAMTLVPIYGFEYNTGLVFATISHESQIVQMLLCGIISLISWAIYSKQFKKQEIK